MHHFVSLRLADSMPHQILAKYVQILFPEISPVFFLFLRRIARRFRSYINNRTGVNNFDIVCYQVDMASLSTLSEKVATRLQFSRRIRLTLISCLSDIYKR